MTLFHNLFSLHTYEVIQEEKVCFASTPVAKIIICRCPVCGKIKTYRVPLTCDYYEIRCNNTDL